MSNSYTNIRLILDKILKHPLLQDITLEIAVDYTIDFMRIVGMPGMFTEKISILNVINYRALLPVDFYEMNQVRIYNETNHTFRYSTNTFHLSENAGTSYDLTYKIQGGYIYTSKEVCDIEISYQAIETDEGGYPLIPDNSSFTRALELYIKKQWFTIQFDLGKIPQAVLHNTQQEYAWAVGDCQVEFNRMSLDKAESFYNSWKTLIIRNNEHRKGFINNGSKEILKIK